MRAVVVKGELYVAANDVLEGKITKKDIQELLNDKYKETGRIRSVSIYKRKEKQMILNQYSELIKLWEKGEVLDRLSVQYKIKKTLLKRWVRQGGNDNEQ